MAYYFVEVAAVCSESSSLSETLSLIEEAVKMHTGPQSLRFKVFGENKFVFIAQGDEPEAVINDLNDRGHFEVKTIPVRPYGTFAQTILGIDSSLTGQPNVNAFQNPQKIFFAHITIDMPDMGMEEFLKIWKEEAMFGMTAMSQGRLDSRPFKTVATRSVLVFFNVPNGEAVDATVHALPFAMNPKTANGFHFPTVREMKPF